MAGIAALALAYFLSQFYRSFLAVLTPVLETELGATKADFAHASGAWFIAFALMQFGVGVSLDRFGPRRTAAVMLAMGGGGGALVFGLAKSPTMLVIAMALIGIGCAPVLMASLFIFAKTFRMARFAVATSWFVALGSLGNVFGATPLAAASESFGWRPVILSVAALTLLVALALLVFVRDPARNPEEPADGGGFGGFGELLRLRVLWPIIPLTAINYAPAVGIRGLWAGPYLTDVFGADSLVIGNVTLFMAFAMVAGSFLYGPLDTVFRTRKWVAVGGNTISVAAICTLALMPQASMTVTTILLVLIGVSGASYGLLMAHARAFVPAHLIGRGVTLMNFFSIGGVGVMQFVTGAVVTGAASPGEPVAAYQALFGFYALTLAASVFVYLKARDARP
jgi:sugar phosphate permease